ncbi:alpha-amylase family glycosyl hydrolase [Pedobacter sp. L105]|uniref:alpha-amylase family glycosyl hydrolase n=1 Tax=Pedobacter sp. L105 TaxID=1641871 RepID=UPI00131E2235|nr:alpha-amylase family glycosyl hydrolase [Pedobacter sp. L105]
MTTTNLYCWSRFLQRGLQTFLLFLLAFIAQTSYAQDPAQYGTPFASVPNPMDVNLYQVNIRAFSSGSNLPGVTARLDQIRALGTNVIYLMPIYPVGTDSRSKIASSTSPYSIKDFTSVGTEYGTLSDLRALVDGAHNRGMAVILDFAVNGTSWDHPWITQHSDWYNKDASNNITQLATFADVAGLNFANTSMRTAMINAMRYWIFAANVDGFRCDFANNPPLDFWTQAISNLRGITTHHLLLFAEGDRRENFQTGFDYTFGDQFYYQALKPIHNGTSVAQLQTSIDYEYTYATGTQQVMHYTGNHDTSGDGTPLEIFGSTAGVMANFVVCAYMRGVPFLYGGQEVAFSQRIPWPYDSVNIDWTLNPSVTAEFTKVLNYRTSSTAIRRGTMTNYSNTNVCAFTKISGAEKVVVLVNLRGSSSTYTIPSNLAGSYNDAYSGSAVTLTSGAQNTLAAYQYMVLTNQSGGTTPTGTTYYQIVNRYQANNYLYDAGNGKVAYGTTPNTNNYQWTRVDAGSGYYLLKNRATGNLMHVEDQNGNVEATTANTTWYSAMWSTAAATDGWSYIQNRWQTNEWIHIENLTGFAQYAGAQTGWYSAMWQFVNPVTVP